MQFKNNCSIRIWTVLLGMCLLLMTTHGFAATVISGFTCLPNNFVLERSQQKITVARFLVLKGDDKIFSRQNQCTITLSVNNKPKIVSHYPHVVSDSDKQWYTRWWEKLKNSGKIASKTAKEMLWDEEEEESQIAGARAPRGYQLAIPLLKDNYGRYLEQHLVGTGKRFLYLGWSGNEHSYTVTIMGPDFLSNEECNQSNNCWETTTDQNFTSLLVNLDTGKYKVRIKSGSSTATAIGYFHVIDFSQEKFSNEVFLADPDDQEQQLAVAAKWLEKGQRKWALEAYQHVASISEKSKKVRQIRMRLEEGLQIPNKFISNNK